MDNDKKPSGAPQQDGEHPKIGILLSWLIVLVGIVVIFGGAVWFTGGIKS